MSVAWILCHGTPRKAVQVDGRLICPLCRTQIPIPPKERRGY